MIVVDASAMLELLLQTSAAAALDQRLFGNGAGEVNAPHLLDVEVANVLRREAVAGKITASRGAEALCILADLPVRRVAHLPLLPRIWALRHNLSAYDASYVALAEALGAVLITRDKRLAAASGYFSARIELVQAGFPQ